MFTPDEIQVSTILFMFTVAAVDLGIAFIIRAGKEA